MCTYLLLYIYFCNYLKEYGSERQTVLISYFQNHNDDSAASERANVLETLQKKDFFLP